MTKLFQLSRDFSDSVPFKAKVKHEKQNVDSERKHGVEYDTRAKDFHEIFSIKVLVMKFMTYEPYMPNVPLAYKGKCVVVYYTLLWEQEQEELSPEPLESFLNVQIWCKKWFDNNELI